MNRHTCVVCDSPVRELLGLGTQALANNLIDTAHEPYEAYELGVAGCTACGHVQLTHFVDPSLLFKDYLYASGTSTTLRNFFAWFARALSETLPVGGRILELASNDGSLLSSLAAEGFSVVGVDPAENLAQVARAKGHEILTGFFPETAPPGTFDAIVAMNVAAHTPEPLDFVRGIARSLAPDGVALIQTSQAMMLANGEFDTIYHEHYSFYSAASMRKLAERAGLVLEHIELVSVHGTSFVFFLRHPGARGALPSFASAPFGVTWPRPSPPPLHSGFTGEEAATALDDFAAKAAALMQDVRRRVERHRAAGRDIALVGVAAKALTFVRAAGIAPDRYFDEAELKIGKFVPGASTPVEPLSAVADLTRETVFLIGAWNFADELMRKLRAQGSAGDHRFLIHLPQLREEMFQEIACAS